MDSLSDKDSRNLQTSRREFLKRSAATVAAPALAGSGRSGVSGAEGQAEKPGKPPNILIVIADQFRWDCIGAYGLNPMDVTPNLDSIAGRGAAFQNAVTNQPWCSPSRACLLTGQYGTEHGVWRLSPGLRPDATTLAKVLRGQGYTANYIGKWHLAPHSVHSQEVDPLGKNGVGYVPPEYRGGFLDLWEASNVLEITSHPYEGNIWDAHGKVIHYEGVYRTDYLTQLAVQFLRQKHEKPFLLVVSQLEPHEQNDADRPVPPKKYLGKYVNPFVPHDLRSLPGMWQELLPDYYGGIKAIDDSVGVLLKTLSEQGLSENTIVVMLSDHGNHFLTRTYAEWKCTPHDSSIHIPLLIQGPGFDHSGMIPEVVSMVDVAPSLLDAVGVKIPATMQGRSFMPVLRSAEGRKSWRQEAFIQFANSAIGRALRTDKWTYCAIDPNKDGMAAPNSSTYQEYQLYDLASDPHQLLNLVGRRETGNWNEFSSRSDVAELRERLKERIMEAGEGKPVVTQILGRQVVAPGQPNPAILPPPYGLYR
ncbi:MAG TPA: sulfatase-like hydrolase/transferase [Terriglobia bacterium]|nr:sulfatase-like hydrolase/transferase [Terriglobia bacterium]